MPRGDRTGPQGLGPMTGRRMGDCADAGSNGPTGYGFGRGFFSRAWGGGRGYGRGFGLFNRWTDVDSKDEEVIQNEITTMKNRLSFLENLLGKKKSDE